MILHTLARAQYAKKKGDAALLRGDGEAGGDTLPCRDE
jgi:hypothetical protein